MRPPRDMIGAGWQAVSALGLGASDYHRVEWTRDTRVVLDVKDGQGDHRRAFLRGLSRTCECRANRHGHQEDFWCSAGFSLSPIQCQTPRVLKQAVPSQATQGPPNKVIAPKKDAGLGHGISVNKPQSTTSEGKMGTPNNAGIDSTELA